VTTSHTLTSAAMDLNRLLR